MLSGKKILLGICGSIAAYKAAYLTRLLVKTGADVRIIMTPSATTFITPLTLSTLSKNPVLVRFEADDESGTWHNHVELGSWADMLVIAPASANTIAKMANGVCDNLLLAVYLSARCPVWCAPAMDLDMWQHPATQSNIEKLAEFGNEIIPVDSGELASGLVGEGRMAEPEEIFEHLKKNFKQKRSSNSLTGKKVLITAGPTYEPIDPVRFIGNHSSGKMGIALAREASDNGAEVVLIKGQTDIETGNDQITEISAPTADDMYSACMKHFNECDIAILAADVADFTPESPSPLKIKKGNGQLNVKLKKTKDILKALGEKKKKQLLVGFALETDNEIKNATQKLKEKNQNSMLLQF